MLVKYLTLEDKEHLLELAELLSLADNPLRWDGKKKEEINSLTNLHNLSIEEVVQESALISELREEGNRNTFFSSSSDAKEKLIKKIKSFPLQAADEPTNRADAANSVLLELLKGKKFDIPSVPKLMLFELMSMALCDGSISSIEWILLKEFQRHHHLEDFIFDDILERAEAVNQEVSKTIALILE